MSEENWMKRQLSIIAKESESWPEWRKQEARTRFHPKASVGGNSEIMRNAPPETDNKEPLKKTSS